MDCVGSNKRSAPASYIHNHPSTYGRHLGCLFSLREAPPLAQAAANHPEVEYIEALADDHPSKPKCLTELSRLFGRIGNHVERKRFLIHTLELQRGQGDEFGVAQAL